MKAVANCLLQQVAYASYCLSKSYGPQRRLLFFHCCRLPMCHTACQSKSYRPLWRLSLTVCCNSLPMHHTASLSKSYRPLWRLLLTVGCNRLPMHHWQLPTSRCGSFNPLHQCFQGVVAELPNDAPLLHDVVVASHAHTCQQHHKYRRMDPFVVPGHKLQQLKPQTTATKIQFTSRNKQG